MQNSFFVCLIMSTIFFFSSHFQEKKINDAGGIPAMLRNIYFIICNKDTIQYKEYLTWKKM